ncbi:hypothetical protein [Micromonospora sp. HM5-17]|uniref:hypothetical protein n=1 Tax=Micromonospora sp. HM5-17 TaxID=2487710 RepID=UPI000F484BA1|nr:hypothetical protein [Micromonospora sp. HM5-17]ROT31377.1 hypothetical protein EF879_17545 [Micromonospora sp. HM5-17]
MGNRLSRKKVLGGLVAGGVLTVGLAAPAVAFAQDETPTPSPSASASTDGGPAHVRDHRGDLAEKLATELGVPQERVEAALEKIWAQHRADHQGQSRADHPSAEQREAWLRSRLDQAVSDGKLTREQADAILAAVKAGVLPGWGGFGHGGHGWHGHGGDEAEK